jgi:hypothetical protein
MKFLAFALTILITSATWAAPQTIHFGCMAKLGSPLFLSVERIYKQAFEALGYHFHMSHAPSLRDAANAKSGRTDGSCARSLSFMKNRGENLVVVDVPLTKARFWAWSRSPDIKIFSFNDIVLHNYKIALRNGMVPIEVPLSKYPEIDPIRVTSSSQGLKLLAAGRIDLYIDERELILRPLNNMDIAAPIYHAGLLYEETVFPVLHQKHAGLADLLAQELRKQLSHDKAYLLPLTR